MKSHAIPEHIYWKSKYDIDVSVSQCHRRSERDEETERQQREERKRGRVESPQSQLEEPVAKKEQELRGVKVKSTKRVEK